MFFGYNKYHIVTAILLDLKLPSFGTVIHNLRYTYDTTNIGGLLAIS